MGRHSAPQTAQETLDRYNKFVQCIDELLDSMGDYKVQYRAAHGLLADDIVDELRENNLI